MAANKSLLKRLLRVAKWAIATLVLALVLLLILLHTGLGRDLARDEMVERANDALPGTLEMEGLEGSLLGEPTLRGISLFEPAADSAEAQDDAIPVLKIDSVQVGVSLIDLLSSQLTLTNLDIDGLHLNLVENTEGELNLLTSLIDPEAEESDPMPLELSGIRLSNSSLNFTDSQGSTTKLENLSLENLELVSDGTTTEIKISNLQASLPLCEGQELHLSGDLQISEDGFTSTELAVKITSGKATVGEFHLRGLDVAADMSNLEVAIDGQLEPALLRCLVPDTKWRKAIAFDAEVNKAPQDPGIAFRVGLKDKSLQLSKGDYRPDAKSIKASLSLQDFEPSQYVELPSLIVANGDFEIGADGLGTDELQAHVLGEGKAKADELELALSELSLVNVGKMAKLSLTLGGYEASANVKANVDWAKEPQLVTNGLISASVPDLATLPVQLPLAGGLALVNTSFHGPIDGLKVEGRLEGRRLRYEDSRVSQVGVDFAFDDLPSSFAGKVGLNAQGVRQGTEYVGPVVGEVKSDELGKVFQIDISAGRQKQLWAKLKAELVLGLGRNDITFEALRLRHRTLQAALRKRPGHPAKLTLWEGGNLSVADLRLSVAGGSVAIDGTLDSELRAKMRGIKLAPILPLLGDSALPVSASFSGEATAKLAPAGLSATLALETDELRIAAGSEPLQVTMSGRMDPKLLSGAISVGNEESGAVEIKASIRPPKGRLGHNAARLLRSAQLRFHNFDLQVLRPIHPELESLGGQLNGRIDLSAGARRIEGTLIAAEIVHESFTSKRSLEFDIDATQKMAELKLVAEDSEIGAAQLTLRARPPGPLHSPWLWPPSMQGWVRDSELVIDRIDLLALERALPGVDSRGLLKSGSLAGTVKLLDRGSKLEVQLTSDKLQGRDLPPITASIDSTIKPKTSRIAWNVSIDGENQVRGQATLADGLELMRYRDQIDQLVLQLQKTKVDASASAETSSPALWSKLVGSKNPLPIAGKARANADFHGTVLKPSGSLQLEIDDADVDGIAIKQVSLNAEVAGDDARAQLLVSQSRHRRVQAEVTFDLKSEKLRSGMIDAQDIDLRLLRALDKSGEGILSSIAGVANGKFQVTGHWDQLEPSGSLRVKEGAIDFGGTLLPIVGLSMLIEAKDRLFKLEGKAKSGSGRIKLTGQAKVTSEGLEDMAIRLRSTKIPVVVASLVCSVDLDSHSQIDIKPGLVDIKTNIDSALVRVPVRSFLAETRSLHSLDGMSDLVYVTAESEAEAEEVKESESRVQLRIRANNSVVVSAKVMQAKLGLDLNATFADNKVVVKGGANVETGYVDLFERRYRIEKASANFRGRVPVNPSFDFRLKHDFDQLSLSILGRGDLDAPKITFVADPAEYDQSTLLAIVLGQAPAQDEDQQGLRDNALSALSTYAANKVQEVLAPILPFDIDVLRVENTDNDGYLYVGGKWITDDWFVAYNYRTLADESENTNEAQSKYRLSKAWSLEGVAGESEAGLDILWTKRWGK